MKKLIVLLLSIILVISMAGCSSKETGGKTKDGKDIITVWTYPHYPAHPEIGQKSYEDHLKELIADIEKENKDIKVKYEILSWEEGAKKFDVALNSGNPPDVFFSTMQPKYINTGLAIPLDKYLDKDDLEDLEPFAKENFTLDGKIWAVSQWIALHSWGGNRALLEEAGVDIAKIQKDGWTWEEFYDIAKKFTGKKTKDGKDLYGFLTQGKSPETFGHLMRNYGILRSLSPEGKFQWGGKEAVETLEFLKKLMDEKIMPKETAGIDEQKMIDMFNDGQAAIFGRTGPYQITQNDNRNKEIDEGKIKGEKIDMVLLPFPHHEGSKEVATGGGGGMWLFKQKNYKGDKHTDNAAKVLKYLTGTKSSITAATQFIPPARKSGQKMYSDMLQFDTDNGKFIQRTLGYVVRAPQLDPVMAQKDGQIDADGVEPKFQGFLAGELTPKETVEQWTKIAESILK
ncbi:ABC transporter substrate-binding protein [Heyndrickxia sp. NPDC080065]|uniref:ABC transporter substrate-binding protein n=1 Tax=Heyndrickxia sp. NPDC080065 TaxID=3390568 RepID=UPI003D088BD0